MIGEYETTKTLGTGAFGTVRLAKKKNSEVMYAIKSISKQSILRSQMGSQVKKEISIMKSLDHPNIVQVVEVLMSTEYLYIVMDYVSGGELYAKITRGGRLSDTDCCRYVHQLCSALNYCHSRNVCHRDIKPENILLDRYNNVLLADFGFASIMEIDELSTARNPSNNAEEEDTEASKLPLDEFCGTQDNDDTSRTMEGRSKMMKVMSTMCGTMAYMAPEILNRDKYLGDKADIWSLGIVIYVLLVGFMPFRDGDTARSVYTIPHHVKKNAADFVSKMLMLEPEKRFSARRLLLHPWLENQSSESTRLSKEISSDSQSDDTSEEEKVSLNFNLALSELGQKDTEGLLESVQKVMNEAGWKTRLMSGEELKASIMSSNGVVMVAVSLKEDRVFVRHANLSRDADSKTMKDLRNLLVSKLTQKRDVYNKIA